MTKTPNEYPMALTVKDVAEILGISQTKSYEMLPNPKFPVIRDGRRLIIPRDRFFRWLDPDYQRGTSTSPTREPDRNTDEDKVTEICTHALVEAVNKGTITVQEVVNWAIGRRLS